MNAKKIIGISSLSYPEKRNFAGYIFDSYKFKKVIDLYKFPSYILLKFKNKINRKWQNTFQDFGLNNCNFYHFFNVISKGNKPYITTYETMLPRWRDTDEDFNIGISLLAKNNCKKIIALSVCAYKKQEELIKKYRPDLLDLIMNKNIVLLPPQVPFMNDISEKRKYSESLVFTIVGADFFRKGGVAILNTFDKLLSENKSIILNIVSSLNYGDYASKTTQIDLANALQIINKHKGRIIQFNQLDNTEVKRLLLATDVALLPSLAETFGYFILEAQAAGCPVITTDIRAMPEINNESKGWIINITEENLYDADLTKIEALNASISLQLNKIINSILENPSIIQIKGIKALEDIKQNHSIEKHKEKLLEIYNEI